MDREPPAMRDFAVGTDLDIAVPASAESAVRRHVRGMIAGIRHYTDLPMPHARVKLTPHPDAASTSPVIAQARIELGGRVIGAQVAARSAHEGIELLADVLRHRISRLQQHWEACQGLAPDTLPAQWRHPDERDHLPHRVNLPPGERKVVRRKRVELAKCSVAEAIEDLELAGYSFHMFSDAETGLDSVVYRREAGRHGRLSVGAATALDEEGAIDVMNRTDRVFLFFADRATGRGNVIYRRVDGHYAVITPATA
jgi:hypothetical protein